MKAILSFIRNEPAMVVSGVLAALNLFLSLSGGQEEAVRMLVESIVILLGGGAIRQSVTPTSKLPKS